MDSLLSRMSIKDFFEASSMLQIPFEEMFSKLDRLPICIISDLFHRIELSKAQVSKRPNPASPDLVDIRDKMVATDAILDGIIVNTFEELKLEYVKEFKKIKGGKVWCIGPVSACNKSELEKVKRGLEASNQPFIWVMRGGEKTKDLEKCIKESKFEESIKGRGFLIKGWSPQILVLNHRSVGAFLTHCGWNFTMEGVCSGLPIITCPLFAEQFFNEKLITEVLGTGVSVGVKAAVTWGLEEQSRLVMKHEDVKSAIDKVFYEGVEGEDHRRKAKEMDKMVKNTFEEGGSSYVNIEALIQDVMQQNLTNV